MKYKYLAWIPVLGMIVEANLPEPYLSDRDHEPRFTLSSAYHAIFIGALIFSLGLMALKRFGC